MQKIHGFLVKPANFDASKKYPLLVLIHGGPQGAWNDSWSYRWNPQMFRQRGLRRVYAEPARLDRLRAKIRQRNFRRLGRQSLHRYHERRRGSFETQLVSSIKTASARRAQATAAIWSTGFSGTTTTRAFSFKALVSHAGVYNLESMAARPKNSGSSIGNSRECRGKIQSMYERWSPHNFADNFNTPTLVTQGEIDYRVPVDESLQLYTALQRRTCHRSSSDVSRRRTLDSEAAKFRILVRAGFGLVRQTSEPVANQPRKEARKSAEEIYFTSRSFALLSRLIFFCLAHRTTNFSPPVFVSQV